MSLRVLVIPEDFVNDQYFLKPLFQTMFEVIGRKASVEVCTNPRLRGISDALDWERIRGILNLAAKRCRPRGAQLQLLPQMLLTSLTQMLSQEVAQQ